MAERNSSYPPFHPQRPDLPLTLGKDEFEREFPTESQYIEFKRGISRNQLQDTVVAFSNAEGGVILVGVDDTGDITGKPLDSGATDSIHQVMRDVHDPGRYSLHQVSVDGRPIIAISIARREEGFAQSSNGVVRIRKGTRDEPLFGSALQHFVNERSARRYELTPTSISTDAIDPQLLETFCSAYDWSPDKATTRLAENGYIADNQVTVAGALYLLPDPSEALGKSHIELLRYRDDESVDYDLRLEIGGTLTKQLLEAAQRVQDETGTQLVVLGVRRYDLPKVPPVVIREAIANALAHRSYELDRTPVRIPDTAIVGVDSLAGRIARARNDRQHPRNDGVPEFGGDRSSEALRTSRGRGARDRCHGGHDARGDARSAQV